MDLLKKVETLLNATARAKLPRRQRRSPLDEQEEKLLADIRQAVADVQAQEQRLADRLKQERAQAGEAAQRGDRTAQRTHQRRAEELERQLEQESIQAINLEDKLAALEEKLALAQEAVDQQARETAQKDAEASKVLAQGGSETDTRTETVITSTSEETSPDDFSDDPPDIAGRKSRLSG
jgi:hypothetical protein